MATNWSFRKLGHLAGVTEEHARQMFWNMLKVHFHKGQVLPKFSDDPEEMEKFFQQIYDNTGTKSSKNIKHLFLY